MKSLIFTWIVLLLAACGETNISGSIQVDSISPAPDSELPELGETVEFEFQNIGWEIENKEANQEVDIVVWFVEAKNSQGGGVKVGWKVHTTTQSSGFISITEEMPSWNHSTFTHKPTTLSFGLCETSTIIDGIVEICASIANTETFEYQ
ncbi:hypothetical protein NBRC116188_09450 [Oceaniserpentilla sp. 4NH20-0058]|uniref:hypothetical protein n=1 Tax=Oceaniserpentilla sp. 4NH20-0058 TaxID=3127660 RepID=UPI003108E336